jgi:hypothetical protein
VPQARGSEPGFFPHVVDNAASFRSAPIRGFRRTISMSLLRLPRRNRSKRRNPARSMVYNVELAPQIRVSSWIPRILRFAAESAASAGVLGQLRDRLAQDRCVAGEASAFCGQPKGQYTL